MGRMKEQDEVNGHGETPESMSWPFTIEDISSLRGMVQDHLSKCLGIECGGRLDNAIAHDKALLEKFKVFEEGHDA